MSDLEPITRAENFWVNEGDLEPITRKEQYIKHLYDETQVVPEYPKTREEYFINKAGEELHDVTIEQLTATENGTYSEEGVAYSPVIVEVPEPTLISKNITANGDYSASADNADGYSSVSVNVPLPSNAYLLKSIEHEDIATFADGTDNFVKSLEVAIEPQQDLHGYDSPWFGGSGKNKFALNISEIKNLNTTGTWVDETYTINGAEYKINTDNAGNITSINARSVAQNPNGDLKISATLQANSYILSSGFSETNGVNDTFLQKNGVTIARGNNSSPGSNFTLEEAGEVILHIRLSRNDSSFVCYPMIRLATVSDSTFEPYSNICPISGHTEANVVVSPTTDAEDGTTYNISFGSAGTVYGGTLDVTTGLLTVDRGYLTIDDFNSSGGSGVSAGGLHWFDVTNKPKGKSGNKNICSICNYVQNGWTSTITVLSVGISETIPVRIYDSSESLSDFKDKYPNLQVCYELATPLTIQLTPTIIKSLQGDNNLFASTGEIIKLEYLGKEA